MSKAAMSKTARSKTAARSKSTGSKAAKAKTARSKPVRAKTAARPMAGGPLAGDMGRLARELSQASEFRTSAIDDMRRATQATLAACATMRGELLRDYRGQAQKFLSSLVRETSAQRRAATKHVMKIARDRQEIASQLRGRLQHDAHSLADAERTGAGAPEDGQAAEIVARGRPA